MKVKIQRKRDRDATLPPNLNQTTPGCSSSSDDSGGTPGAAPDAQSQGVVPPPPVAPQLSLHREWHAVDSVTGLPSESTVTVSRTTQAGSSLVASSLGDMGFLLPTQLISSSFAWIQPQVMVPAFQKVPSGSEVHSRFGGQPPHSGWETSMHHYMHGPQPVGWQCESFNSSSFQAYYEPFPSESAETLLEIVSEPDPDPGSESATAAAAPVAAQIGSASWWAIGSGIPGPGRSPVASFGGSN